MAPKPRTILCIDDDTETLRSRTLLLEMHGFGVITALSGEIALTMLATGRAVDLVLLDYVMPGMAGDRVAEELKRRRPALPIIVMSGFTELPTSLLRMVDGYIRKGQPPEIVLQTINIALSSRHQEEH